MMMMHKVETKQATMKWYYHAMPSSNWIKKQRPLSRAQEINILNTFRKLFRK